MRYPASFIENVKNHFRISDIIGKRVPLRKFGREYKACCPFHADKSPSFTVNDEKNFYYCFGCHAAGDVIGFIKEFEKITYKQAIEELARQAGIPLPELTKEAKAETDDREKLYEIMDVATRWFSHQLQNENGANAREYLKKRGIDLSMIQQFRLGYAPTERTMLRDALLKRNIPEKIQLDLGLLSKSEDNKIFDKFRGRLIFPIRDSLGRVVAFGGRLLATPDPNQQYVAPKYLNSPDTKLFKKGDMLYNADQARKAAYKGEELIVAEGYMDVISLTQAGFSACVAPLGTAVTEQQLRILWKMQDEPIMCLDGDNAGEKAMIKTAGLATPLLEPGKSLRFCLLPAGEDPDSIIKTRGLADMRQHLAGSLPLVEVLWRKYYLATEHKTPEQRAKVEENLLKIAAEIQNPSVRQYYEKEFKQRLWEAGRAQSANVWKNSKKTSPSAKKTPLTNLTLAAKPPAINNFSSQLERCYQSLILLLWQQRELLEDGSLEDFLSDIKLNDHILEAARMFLLGRLVMEISIEAEINKRARNEVELMFLRKTTGQDVPTRAKFYLNELRQRISETLLMKEFAQAEQQLAQHTNEEKNNHLNMIREEKNKYYKRQDMFGNDNIGE